jgi:ketosteroid isomerase-like protein
MSEGANAELIRKVFADANRMAEVGGFDAWLDFFSEEIVWEAVEDAPDAGTYRGHGGFAATSRTGSRRSTDSTMSCAG